MQVTNDQVEQSLLDAGVDIHQVEELDAEALRRKYLDERDKRLRAEGSGQYTNMDDFGDMIADPFSEPIERESRTITTQVVLVGGGFSGLTASALLAKRGIDDVVIVEDGGDFGGTWYWNRYPGARCDIESYIYMPLLEDIGTVPSERYATTTEIWEHARALGRHFKLYDRTLFQTRVVELKWDDDSQHWVARTNRGDVITAQFAIVGSGQLLSRPKLPGVPGIEDFQGRSFHTSRWDYDYTGGSTAGGLTKLHDKKVAIIGTGATAVQAVPFLGEYAQHLYVVQRTPSIIDIRGNEPTDQAWAARLQDGWQAERMMNFDLTLEGRNDGEVLVQDQWPVIWGRPDLTGLDEEQAKAAMDAYDVAQMERIRGRIDAIVDDPETAEALKPYYSRFCKRPCFSDEYLQTFNRPNVTLVHTDGKGPGRITAKGVVYNGVEYEVDCIIYATGFESFALTPSEAGRYQVIGQGGITLDEKWGDDFQSLHGLYTAGFPNMFVLGSARMSAASFNIPHRVLNQAIHVTSLIQHLVESELASMEVTPESEERWQKVVESARGGGNQIAAQLRDCTPGYYNNEGNLKSKRTPIVAAGYAAGTRAFNQELDEWRTTQLEADLVLRKAE